MSAVAKALPDGTGPHLRLLDRSSWPSYSDAAYLARVREEKHSERGELTGADMLLATVFAALKQDSDDGLLAALVDVSEVVDGWIDVIEHRGASS